MDLSTLRRSLTRTAVPLLVCAFALAASGCLYTRPADPYPRQRAPRTHRTGPPPHAPAHGYRYKHRHDGVPLRYHRDLDVYVVVGHAGHYFDGRRFYRRGYGAWEASPRFRRGWRSVYYADLPYGLSELAYRDYYGKTKYKSGKKYKSHKKYKQKKRKYRKGRRGYDD